MTNEFATSVQERQLLACQSFNEEPAYHDIQTDYTFEHPDVEFRSSIEIREVFLPPANIVQRVKAKKDLEAAGFIVIFDDGFKIGYFDPGDAPIELLFGEDCESTPSIMRKPSACACGAKETDGPLFLNEFGIHECDEDYIAPDFDRCNSWLDTQDLRFKRSDGQWKTNGLPTFEENFPVYAMAHTGGRN